MPVVLFNRSQDDPSLSAVTSDNVAGGRKVAEFLLANMSKRMAEGIREEMQDMGNVKPKVGEEAMTQVVNAIRRLEAAGEITLNTPEDVEDGEAA